MLACLRTSCVAPSPFGLARPVAYSTGQAFYLGSLCRIRGLDQNASEYHDHSGRRALLEGCHLYAPLILS